MSVKSYNSSLKEILITQPSDFMFVYRNQGGVVDEAYKKFDQDFSTYLSKLPNNSVKKYVSELFNRNLIVFGNASSKAANINFVRTDIQGDKLKAVALDIRDFDIDIKTGETRNIDECIYASYFGFLRFAVVANRTSIKNDRKLQELLAQYFYQIMISIIESGKIDTPKQKFFFKIIAYYAFYRHFIRETSASTIRILRDIFDEGKELFNEFLPRFKDIDKYDSVKDFAKMLIDTKVITIDPNVFSINLLKKYKQYGFYCIYGTLDMFVAFIVASKYPFEFLGEMPTVNSNIQKDIEEIMIGYMRKVNFV